MKKITIILLIACMVLGVLLTGCSNAKETIEVISDVKEDVQEIINTEDTETDKSIEGTDQLNEDTDTETTIDPVIIEQIVTDFGESFGDIEVDKDTIIEIYDDLDLDLDKDIDAQADAEIMEVLGNVLKYKVNNLDYEGFEEEVYNLSYHSEADWEDIAVYFHMLLRGTADFKSGAYHKEMGTGGAIKGTLFGMTTVVDIHYNEDIDETYVVTFCRP